MDSPAILLTKPYQPVPTYGTKYEKPNTTLFQNPGVIVDGQFPYYEVTPPTEQMWQDEAYNDVKRQIADASARYLNGNPRDIFFKEDPVVKHLLQEDDKVRELLDKQRAESNLLKQEKQIKALLALGFDVDEAVATVKAKNQADAVKQVFEGKGQEETVDDAIEEMFMTPPLPDSPPRKKTPRRNFSEDPVNLCKRPVLAPQHQRKNEAVPMDLTEPYKSPARPQQQAVPMDLTEPYKSPKKGGGLSSGSIAKILTTPSRVRVDSFKYTFSPQKKTRGLSRADLDTTDGELLNQAFIETRPIGDSSVMAGAGGPSNLTQKDVVKSPDGRGRPISEATLIRDENLYKAYVRDWLKTGEPLPDFSKAPLNELKKAAVGFGLPPSDVISTPASLRSLLEQYITNKYNKLTGNVK